MSNFPDIVNQTKQVFLSFVKETANFKQDNEVQAEANDAISEDQVDAIYVTVGNNLAEIADKVFEKYSPEFDMMAKLLNLTSDSVVTQFMNIVNLVDYKHIGMILVVFCFGYYLLSKFIRNIPNLLPIIQSCIMNFVGIRLVRWIAEQGGWVAIASKSTKKFPWLIITGVAVVLIGVYAFRNSNKIH